MYMPADSRPEGGEVASHWSGNVRTEEVTHLYIFALGQLFAVCGVPLAVVVGVVVVARAIYSLVSRRE